MRLHAAVIALALTGFGSSIAIAKGPTPGAGSPASAAGRGGIEICHRTGSAELPFRSLSVSRGTLEEHLRHGDLLVPRGATCSRTAASATAS
jgi:hypothetical protein